MIKRVLVLCFLVLGSVINAQNMFTVSIAGLDEGKKATVIAQQGAKQYIEKRLDGSGGQSATFDLTNGEWTIKVDAPGYSYDPARTFNVPAVSNTSFTLTPYDDSDYTYEWEDDDSDSGHSQQSYVVTPIEIEFLGDTIEVPRSFSSHKMAREYGVILNDDLLEWSDETSFKLLSNIERLPFTQKHWSKNVREGFSYVVSLTDESLQDDIAMESVGGVVKVKISQDALTYALPQTVILDGLRGKYFSKRLYNATLRLFTNNGQNQRRVNLVAKEQFGFEFMKPSDALESLVNEDQSNFQEFTDEENLLILTMLEELPEGMHAQKGLKHLVRRINGQPNPSRPTAAAIAWTGSHYIEFMEVAFTSRSIEHMQRLILHEKSHFLWAYTFDDELKSEWIKIGEWYEDSSSPSGWRTTNTTDFVSPYAHALNPNEDMAESISYFVQNPQRLQASNIDKFNFIRDRIMHGTRYTAVIPDELTFEVYNIYPDYYYPGKVIASSVKVEGAPDEDKTVTIELELNSFDVEKDGADRAYVRFYSESGSNLDIWLYPVDGNPGKKLRGTGALSKNVKSGYWFLTNVEIYDRNENVRLENAATIGMNMFVKSAEEDVTPPEYISGSTSVSKETNTFEYISGRLSDNGVECQAMKIELDFYDDLPLTRVLSRVGLKGENDNHLFSVDVDTYDNLDAKYSIKKGEIYMPIPEYYPSGRYELIFALTRDEAKNESRVYYVDDPNDFNADNFSTFKESRVGVEISTAYPDVVKPLLDVNTIDISAVPVNPEAPDGETVVSLSLRIKDVSDFIGKESGLREINYILKDPQGTEHNFDAWEHLNKIKHNFWYQIESPFQPGEWRTFDLTCILPKGSAPGTWGLSSVQIRDRANNINSYDFVETVRFDLLESTYTFSTPPAGALNSDNRVTNQNVSNSILHAWCVPCNNVKFNYSLVSEFGGEAIKGSGVIYDHSGSSSGIDFSSFPDGKIKMRIEYTLDDGTLIGIYQDEIIKELTVSVDEDEVANVNIYPNPTSDHVYIKGDLNENTFIRLYSVDGVLLKEQPLSLDKKVDLPQKQGVYFLHILDEEVVIATKKVVRL